jgi:hypothetical protein
MFLRKVGLFSKDYMAFIPEDVTLHQIKTTGVLVGHYKQQCIYRTNSLLNIMPL